MHLDAMQMVAHNGCQRDILSETKRKVDRAMMLLRRQSLDVETNIMCAAVPELYPCPIS
jgi:hypothetical protein